jgi:subtilisin family serine protease
MPSIDNGLLPAFSPNHVLIQYLPGEPAAHLKIQGLALDIVASETITPPGADAEVTRLTLGAGVSVQQAIDALSGLPGVGLVEPDYIVTTDTVSNDTSVLGGQTWGLYGDVGTPVNVFGSQAEEAWAAGYTGTNKVAVGVVDSGIDYTHPDLYLNVWLNQKEIPAALKSGLRDTDGDHLITFRDLNNSLNSAYVSDKNGNGRIDAGDLLNDTRWENGIDEDANGYKDDLVGWDFVNNDNDPMDDNGHGTHVAGTIGAIGGNSVGVAGIGWNTQLVALKFLDASGSGLTSDSIRALDYFTAASKAGTGVDFVATNNSWGGSGYSGSLLSAITRGAQAQILYVAAAGNGGSDQIGDNNDVSAYYPSGYSTTATAGYEAVISVAAISNTGALASFSNYGATTVDLGAPGVSIYSTTKGGGYGYMSGTSMATPHVTGAIALYASAATSASAATIRADLLNTTDFTSSLDGKTLTDGRLDVGRLLAKLGALPAPPPPPPPPSGAFVVGTAGGDLITPTATVAGQKLPTSGADSLQGMDGADTLDGGAGADHLDGGAGADRYFVDNAGDQVIETLTGTTGGYDTVLASVSYTLPTNVERLTQTGTGSINGTGNALANSLYGNSGSNVLSGLSGNDELFGGAGNDTLAGGAGVDRLTGGLGNDQFLLAHGEANGDTIYDFAVGDVIRLTGYAAGSTIAKVAGSTTDWVITNGVGGGVETIHLANAYTLHSGDFLFG